MSVAWDSTGCDLHRPWGLTYSQNMRGEYAATAPACACRQVPEAPCTTKAPSPNVGRMVTDPFDMKGIFDMTCLENSEEHVANELEGLPDAEALWAKYHVHVDSARYFAGKQLRWHSHEEMEGIVACVSAAQHSAGTGAAGGGAGTALESREEGAREEAARAEAAANAAANAAAHAAAHEAREAARAACVAKLWSLRAQCDETLAALIAMKL